jgi:malate synthase
LLALPLLGNRRLGEEAVQRELENNAQGILGYVVRWVELGLGCSKVPDIYNHELMENRATLRVSAQHVANWLNAGLLTRAQVEKTFARMAAVVDAQNKQVQGYRPMTADLSASHAYQAALELVFAGRSQANGYTEAILYRWRRAFKAEHCRLLEQAEPEAIIGAIA